MAKLKNIQETIKTTTEANLLSPEAMVAFVQDSLPDEAKTEVENILQNNEFEREALSGLQYASSNQSYLNQVEKLNETLLKKSGYVPPKALNTSFYTKVASIAASFAVLVVAGVFAFQSGFFSNLFQSENQAIADKTNLKFEEEKIPSSIENFTPDTISSGDSSFLAGFVWEDSDGITVPEEESPTINENVLEKLREKTNTGLDEPNVELELNEEDETAKDFSDTIKLNNSGAKPEELADLDEKGKKLTPVEIMPQYPGGEIAMKAYLMEKTGNYLNKLDDEKIQTTVYVTFLIDIKGKIRDAKITKGGNKNLNREALKIVKNMPRWIPKTVNGEKTPTQYTIPIEFKK